MLTQDYRDRLTATEAMHHPWFEDMAYKAPNMVQMPKADPIQDRALLADVANITKDYILKWRPTLSS